VASGGSEVPCKALVILFVASEPSCRKCLNMRILIFIAGVILIIGAYVWILTIAAIKDFVIECSEWQQLAQENPQFELDPALIESCALEGVTIKSIHR